MRYHPVVLALLVVVFGGWNVALGQALEKDVIPASPRIVQPIDEGKLARLTGNTHPLARREFDRGIVAPNLSMERMLLLLRRSPEQEAALEAFMARQLDPQSPDFHHWLEPVEFGSIYGPAEADIVAVTNWLQNQGFTVDKVSNGHMFIEFSGTAALVQRAFHTEIHHYDVKGVEHIANSSDPSIPAALSPVVAGVVSLHDFFAKPMHRYLGSVRRDSTTGKWIPENESVIAKPLFNPPATDGKLKLVSPYDFATIYNVLPLWTAAINGVGQTIGIAGRSAITASDVTTFRTAFGLPANAPTMILNGPTGVPSVDDQIESTLDVEWSGAVAKNANIVLVYTFSTATTDGAMASALYIIDNNLAPIMSFSYGNCELAYGTAGNAAYNSMWQQGATEGISEFVAAGDQGSAACDGGQEAPYEAEFGLAVNGSSSTPYDVAVGGTDFTWANSTTNYWSTSNATNGLSALGYIPEVPWNDTCASVDVDTFYKLTPANGISNPEAACQYMLVNDLDTSLVNVAGGTGGVSACTTPSSDTVASCSGGYAKPAWQTGTGVPADGKRDVPDLSLFAGNDSLDTAYIICDSIVVSCTYTIGNDVLAQSVGGTSVVSPAMAGIMALVLQKTGGARQGLPNPVFYELAATDNLTNCNTNTVTSGNSCVFYDITTDNNQVPCNPGSPNCTVQNSGDKVGIINGYNATTGYDLATGLGSVNAANLVNGWASVAGTAIASLSSATLAFPVTALRKASAVEAITLTNTGSGTLTAPTISIIGTDPSSFTQTNTCGTLAATAHCTISVTFKPATEGALTASINIASNASGSPQTVSLTGTGTGVTLSPATLAFGTVATSKTLSVTVKNVGTTTLAFSSAPTITGTGAASFAVLPYSSSPVTSTCLNGAVTLAQNATCTYTVTFTNAGATTPAAASLNIFDNGGGSTQVEPMTGTGTEASLSPARLAFGTVTTSKTLSVTVKNVGTTTLAFSSAPTITGTGAASFAVVPYSATGPVSTCLNGTVTLAEDATCTYSVTFTNGVDTTSFTADLNIFDNGGGSPQVEPLTGNGTEVTRTPAKLAFGTVTTSKTLSVTVKNVGTTTLAFSSAPTITGTGAASFAVLPYSATGPVSTCLNGTVTLAQNASCTYTVTFTNAGGTTSFTTHLNIFDNGGGSPQLVDMTATD
jgi:hypothetical protein